MDILATNLLAFKPSRRREVTARWQESRKEESAEVSSDNASLTRDE